MFAGHDWTLRMSENGELQCSTKLQDVMIRYSRAVQLPFTCNLSHSFEDFQFLRIERRHVFVFITVER